MPRFVALLRGINVGGKNKLPMADLKGMAGELGWQNVRSYIQSGNLVFDADCPDGEALSNSVERTKGFKPIVLVISAADFKAILENCPYHSVTGKDVHIFFLNQKSVSDVTKINEVKADDEDWFLSEHAFYLFAPSGVARSKLYANVENVLGVQATARNWSSVEAINALIAQ